METTPRRLLLLAFGPFPGAAHNPTPALAAALARTLGREAGLGWRVEVGVLAVDWSVPDRIQAWLRDEARGRYQAALALGLGRGARELRVETRAMNLAGEGRLDARGRTPPAGALVADGPAELPGVLHRPPFDHALRRAQAAGHPLIESSDAGRYLCNAVFYHLLLARGAGWLAPEGPVGFCHVPPIRGLTGALGRRDGALAPARALSALRAWALDLLSTDGPGFTSVVRARRMPRGRSSASGG